MKRKGRRVVAARLVRRGGEGPFDREFWRKAGPEAIWSAAWEMVAEANLFRGGDGSQPDFKELFSIFNEEKVEYLVIGAHPAI